MKTMAKNATLFTIAALTAFLVLPPTVAVAVPITTLFGTGLDGSGNPLPGGAADPHYTVVETGNLARVLNNTAPYFPNNGNSQWIWQFADGQPTFVTRTFRTIFDLTGFDHTSAAINGLWGVDNIGVDILINGASTGISLPVFGTGNFTSLHAFSINSGFMAGINTLDFVIQDLGSISAFRAELTGTAQNIPEPVTLALFGFGLAGLGAMTRRRRIA